MRHPWLGAVALLAWPLLGQAADIGAPVPPAARPAWSPCAVGTGLGVLSWLTFYFSGQALGASGGYATVAGLLGRLLARRHTGTLAYFRDHPPAIDWGVMLLAGLLAGSFLSAWTGGEITNRFLPPMWAERFGAGSHLLRASVAFAGGLLMALGARLAGGCTSGHGISGTLQLAVSSWISVACFFVGGITVAHLLYRT